MYLDSHGTKLNVDILVSQQITDSFNKDLLNSFTFF